MAHYNLMSNQAARINYDTAHEIYFDELIKEYLAAGGDLNDIDRGTFAVWYDVEDEYVDDEDEAEARAWAAFQQRVAAAKRNA